MYTNGQGFGTSARQSPQKEAEVHSNGAKSNVTGKKHLIRCICPRCKRIIDVCMMWSGRGMPRKYCPECRVIISAYDKSARWESSLSSRDLV